MRRLHRADATAAPGVDAPDDSTIRAARRVGRCWLSVISKKEDPALHDGLDAYVRNMIGLSVGPQQMRHDLAWTIGQWSCPDFPSPRLLNA